MDKALEYRFDYSAPGDDSAQSIILEASGFAVYSNDSDTLKANVNVTSDDITIKDRSSSSAISEAFVHIDNGTIQESGFTDGNGVFNPTTDLDYTYDIHVYKIGYRPLKVQHTNTTIYDNEIWYGDVQVLGDIAVESGDTLTILPGTNIYVKPTSAVWNYTYSINSRTEFIAYGGHIRAFGTEEEPVHFHPDSGGSGLYQWAGVLAKVGGSMDFSWTQLDSCDFASGFQGGIGPGRVKFTNCKLTGNVQSFGDWRSSSSQDGWFQLDTCWVQGRRNVLRESRFPVGRAHVRFFNSVTQNECYYTSLCSTAALFEDLLHARFMDIAEAGFYGDTEF